MRQLEAVHTARHHDIGKQQTNLWMLSEHLKCLRSARRLKNGVAYIREHRDGNWEHVRIVIDSQDYQRCRLPDSPSLLL